MEIEDRIVQIIDSKNLKRSSIARAAGITPQQLADMLHKRKIIRPEYINPLCKALGVTPNDLFTPGPAPTHPDRRATHAERRISDV